MAPLVTSLVPPPNVKPELLDLMQPKLQCEAMTANRISELLSPFLEGAILSDGKVAALLAYLDLLLKWNAKINLTAVRDAEGIVTRHFGESLFTTRHLFPHSNDSESVIDIGSGAGLPGIPLKIWAPALAVKLIEANQKKATFLREVVRTLHLTNVEVLAERAEDLSGAADLVTFRAVERFEQILEAASRLVSANGRIAILIGESQVQTAKSALPDFHWQNPLPIPESRNRVLLVGRTPSLA